MIGMIEMSESLIPAIENIDPTKPAHIMIENCLCLNRKMLRPNFELIEMSWGECSRWDLNKKMKGYLGSITETIIYQ